MKPIRPPQIAKRRVKSTKNFAEAICTTENKRKAPAQPEVEKKPQTKTEFDLKQTGGTGKTPKSIILLETSKKTVKIIENECRNPK